MSRRLATLVYDRKVGSVHRKAILAYMADRASDNGKGIWASKQTIADETECGRSTVIKIIADFVSEGLVIVAGERPCQNGKTVVYDLNVEAIAALPCTGKGSTGGTSPDRDPSTSGTPPVHQRDPKGSTSGTQTVHEPSMNLDTNVSIGRSTSEREDFERAVSHYNQTAQNVGWPTVQKLSAGRKAAVLRRIRDVGGIDAWIEAISRAARAPHLIGQNDRDWTANFDWLAKAENFTKLMEGNYDPRSNAHSTIGGNSGRRSGGHHSLMAGFAESANQGRSGAG